MYSAFLTVIASILVIYSAGYELCPVKYVLNNS